MTTTELTAAQVADLVRPYVAKTMVGDITLSVEPTHIQLRNGYWRIPIHPSREPERRFRYYEALADLEEEIQVNEGIKVTITPGDPLHESQVDAPTCCVKSEPNPIPMREERDLTPNEVANIVRPYVAQTTVGGITLWLDEARIAFRDGYWNLHVRPSMEPEPMYLYFEALAKLDTELREKEGLKVWIVSGNPLSE